MKQMLEKESALHSMVLRVAVPAADIPNIKKATEELGIIILDINTTNHKDMTIVEMYVTISYSIYALGKLVAYYEQSK